MASKFCPTTVECEQEVFCWKLELDVEEIFSSELRSRCQNKLNVLIITKLIIFLFVFQLAEN